MLVCLRRRLVSRFFGDSQKKGRTGFVQKKKFRRHSANKNKKRRTGDDVKNRFSAIDKKKRRKYDASEMSFPATFGGLKYNRRYDRWTAVVVICNI